MAIVYVNVVGEILAGDGTPAVGDVIFQIPVALRDVVDNVVYAAGSTFTETLAVDGTFTFTGLPSTDSPDVTPTGWLYRVHVHTDIWSESFSTSLPGSFAPVAEFADLVPTETEPCTADGTPCATLAQFADLQAQINAITASDVESVNGQIGVVVLDAADVGADPVGSAAAVLASSLQKAANLSDLASVPAAITNLGLDDVVRGPAGATATAVARFDGITGELIKDTPTTTITDGGELVNRGDVFVRKADSSGEFAQRVSGAGLDYDAAGYDWFFSVWTGTGVGLGVQRVYIRAEQGAELLHAIGRWIWATGPFGGAVHALDPVTGVAELGGKNGLTTINLVGRGAVPGAPAAGTWNLGDLMIDSVGVWHYCTAGGTPGTWT